jgi:23S rRNA (cytosine1962-C5)-methyltransferase
MSADPAQAGSRQGVRPAGSDTQLRVLATSGFADYALVDSGNGRKLERFGRFTVDRPEPQAMWQPALEPGVWLRADASSRASGEEDDATAGAGARSRRCRRRGRCACWRRPVLCRLTSFGTWGFSRAAAALEWMRDWLGRGAASPAGS